jgi:hypothetical protein
LKDAVAIIRYRVRNWLGLYPALFLPAMRLFGAAASRAGLVDPDTDLVIEGFPRSANTFAEVAFEMAQQRRVKLAHHVHVPAQVLYAVQRRIPVLVLLRNPEDAVMSLMIHAPWLPAAEALAAYHEFYERIMPYSEGFVTATFEQVTADYGSVIRRLNTQFGSDFCVFEHTKENMDRCFEVIDEKARARTGKQDISGFVARPTAQKEKTKASLKDAFSGAKERALLEKCRQVYRAALPLSAASLPGEQASA